MHAPTSHILSHMRPEFRREFPLFNCNYKFQEFRGTNTRRKAYYLAAFGTHRTSIDHSLSVISHVVVTTSRTYQVRNNIFQKVRGPSIPGIDYLSQFEDYG